MKWINLLYLLELACHLFLWIYLTLIARKKGKDKPAVYPYIFGGLVVSGYTISSKGIPLLNILFVIAIWGVLSQRRDLRSYFLVKDNFFRSLMIGSCLGLGLGLLFYYFVNPALYLSTLANKPLNVHIMSFIQISIGEEILYRGFLLGCLKKYDFSDFKANMIQSTLFIMGHVPRYVSTNNSVDLIILCVMSLLAGFITLKYRSLLGPAVMHIITNLVPFV